MTTTRGDYYHFHWLTRVQYDALGGAVDMDDLYFISDENVFYKGDQRMADPVEIVSGTFPPPTKAQGRIYINATTLEAQVWDGSSWKVIGKAVTTSLSSGSTDAQIPTAAAVVSYITTLLQQSEIGAATVIHPPVQAFPDLVAITDEALVDKMLCLVENSGSLFRYDAQSIDAPNDRTIFKPTNDDGRWIMLLSSVEINPTDFEWNNEGKLTLKSIATSKITDLDAYITSIAGAASVQHYASLPAVTSEDNGDVAIYTGTTNATYTQGYAYKVVNGAWASITSSAVLATDITFPPGSSDGDIIVHRTSGGTIIENLDAKLDKKAQFKLPAEGGMEGDILILRDEGGTIKVRQENLDEKLRWVLYED